MHNPLNCKRWSLPSDKSSIKLLLVFAYNALHFTLQCGEYIVQCTCTCTCACWYMCMYCRCITTFADIKHEQMRSKKKRNVPANIKVFVCVRNTQFTALFHWVSAKAYRKTRTVYVRVRCMQHNCTHNDSVGSIDVRMYRSMHTCSICK